MKFIIIIQIIISVFIANTYARASYVYMSTTGTKNSGTSIFGDWSNSNCYNNLSSAFSAMSAGDTLVIDDGTYSGSDNKIWQHNLPPSGSSGNLTVIKAKNIPGQNGVSTNQRLKVVFDNTAQFIANNYPHGNENDFFQYVKFEGLRWNGGLNMYVNYNHLYFKQCAVQGEQDGNSSTIGTSGQNNLFEDVVAFGKGRYKFLFYDPSTDSQSRGDGNNVCRRCIARHDWAKKNDLYKDPIAAFSSYFNRGTALLNSIVIDSDLPSYWMDNPGEISGAFYQPNDSGPHKLTIKGSIVLNTAMAALYTRQGSSGHVIEDVVAINTAGGFGLSGATSANRVGLFGSNAANYAYRSDTQMNNVLARNEGLFAYNSIGTNVINTVLRDVNGFAVNGVTVATDYLNIYGAVTGNFSGSAPSTHLITSDPVYSETNLTGGIKYPVRVEGGSTLQSSGLSGGQIGPTIMYRLGVDGAFKGDPDWDTPQGNLWPWPLEEWVQAEMRSMDTQIWSDGTGQVSPYDVGHYDTMPSPYRGFCATGQTLTKYIWESMGNQIPADIYGGVVPGICGSSNGLSLSTAPTVGLCSAGTASAVSGTGPWSWTCAGSGGGSTANCGATLLEVPPVGNASAVVSCPVMAGFR